MGLPTKREEVPVIAKTKNMRMSSHLNFTIQRVSSFLNKNKTNFNKLKNRRTVVAKTKNK
jgi:hypothetical protein